MSEPQAGAQAPPCYRHPDRPALTRCSRCERPICGDDLVEAPVGYQCPACASGGPPVRRLRDLRASAQVTRVVLGLIAVGFVATVGNPSSPAGLAMSLVPAAVGEGQVWRIVSAGFVHAGLFHVGFNGYLLWLLGTQLEPQLGGQRFTTLYVGGLAGGSLGVVLLSFLTVHTPLPSIPLLGGVFAASPFGATAGASGAVFGLMGAAMVGLRKRGVNPWRTDIGTLVLLNLVLTFVIGNISVGGHLGGFAGGALVGAILLRDRDRSSLLLAAAVTVALLGATVALAAGTL